ncbi:MAG: bifunctional D-glycero-beta-D-manno-heptose-7-phosphate kinase/D-glycero-beta-D-manno-heptose 1-phosphate adenylyltransferase HldE [Pseudomonadota bacterium]
MTYSIPDFSSVHVVVAGDVMLDEYWFGSAGRISPEAPVPVVRIDADEGRPGGAANVAVNLARLGARATLTGIVGADDAAAALERVTRAAGVECRFVTDPALPTITKLRVLSRNQQLIRLDRETAAGGDFSLASTLADSLPADVVVLSDYAKGALHDVAGLITQCREAGVPVLVDPKAADFSRYRGATLITPNQTEFEAVAGAPADDTDLVARARALVDDLALDALLVTRSERGMLLQVADEEPVFLSTEAREVFDVTGAGDTVIATLAAGLGAGLSPRDAAALANLAAGLVVRKIGVASVTTSELRVALHQRGKGGRGLVDEPLLGGIVAEARARGERIVMTNGCFDILHAGHVAYLEEAKTLGDRLIVAVNSDDSVRELKGEGRPVNPLADRMAVLAGLAAVDWVVAFTEPTPARLIATILPDVLVKGGDYRPDQIAGGAAVLAAGGEVRVLTFREGRSTSSIIDAIRRR